MILTYKQLADTLKIPLDRVVRFIERPEFAKYRCEAETLVKRRTKNGEIVYTQKCRGVYFCGEFVRIFNKFMERRNYEIC